MSPPSGHEPSADELSDFPAAALDRRTGKDGLSEQRIAELARREVEDDRPDHREHRVGDRDRPEDAGGDPLIEERTEAFEDPRAPQLEILELFGAIP